MDFTLMNELLTATVASLFVESEPRLGVQEETKEKSHSVIQKIDSQGSTFVPSVETNDLGASRTSINTAQSERDLTQQIKDWLTSEGKRKLNQAMRRLHLDSSAVQGKGLSAMNLDELLHEKKSVKGELKVYDQSFSMKWGRQPQRADKEPMRQLYMYYKKLKQMITKKQQASQAVTLEPKKEEPKTRSSSSISAMTNEVMDTCSKIQSKTTERANLRKLLDNYRQDFSRTYHRNIRYAKDIEPVSAEFKRYRSLKSEIQNLEKSLHEKCDMLKTMGGSVPRLAQQTLSSSTTRTAQLTIQPRDQRESREESKRSQDQRRPERRGT